MNGLRKRTDSFLTKILSGNSMSYKQILAIFFPVLLDQAFVTALNMLNTAMISSSGLSAVSAVSTVDSINLFLLNVIMAIATGGTVIVAQYKGRGELPMMTKSASQSVLTTGGAAIFISVLLLLFQAPLLSFLFGNAEPDVFYNAGIYSMGSFLSYPAFAIYSAIGGAMRGAGNTKGSLSISIVTNTVYILLNFLFINLLNMGVLGLSVSLNVSRILGALFALYLLLKRSPTFSIKPQELFIFDFTLAKRILTVGIPLATEQMFFHGGKILTQTFVVQLGTLSMSINALSNSINSLIQLSGGAMGTTAVTVIGQCMGNNDIKDAKKFTKSLIGVSAFLMLISSCIVLIFFSFFVGIFSAPAEIVPSIFRIILVAAIVSPIIWPTSFVLPNVLRASGDGKFTSIASMLSMWLFRVVVGYILGISFGFGIEGIWYAMYSEWGVRTAIFIMRFISGKWCKHKLI